MRFNSKLVHKALLLVSIPLAAELIFIGYLKNQVHVLQSIAEREGRAKQMAISLSEVFDSMVTSSHFVVLNVYLKNDAPNIIKLHEKLDGVDTNLKEMRKLLEGNSQDLAVLDKLKRDSDSVRNTLDQTFDMVGGGDKQLALERMKSLWGELAALKSSLQDVRFIINRIADTSFEKERREQEKMIKVLYAGLVMNIIIVLGLAVWFNRDITRRLMTLVQNAKRLAREEPLLPAVDGTDEIAHLDKVFKDMALALDLARKKEKAIIESMPVALVITDGAGFIQMFNPSTVEMIQYENHELIGKNISELFAASSDDASFLKDLTAKAEGRIDERVIRTKNSKMVPVEVSMTRFAAAEDQYLLIVMLDITERKDIERLKQEFVSMVSHDLRTPLTSIQIFLDMLSQGTFGELSEFAQKKASMADRSATRLIHLINDLLDIEKMESGHLALERTPVPVQRIVERAVESVKYTADKQQIAVDCSNVADGIVDVDENRIVQVLVNLLGNSLKFSPANSTVSISSETIDEQIEIRVQDQGRGIPLEMHKSIFERFKQVEVKDATEKKGTGLGLPICRAIVEQHDGSIGVISKVGEGSTFWIRLPKHSSLNAPQNEVIELATQNQVQ